MSNDYFNHETPMVPHTVARASAINDVLNAVVAGFDRLPRERELKENRATFGTDSGAANQYAVALPYPIAAYTAGLTLSFKAANTNTGDSTLDVDGLGAKKIRAYNGNILEPGQIVAGAVVTVVYDGADFRLTGPAGAKGLVWQGTWDAGTAYQRDDGVSHKGAAWIASAPTAAGDEPGVAAAWSRLTGDGITWRGTWDSGTAYARNDAVHHAGAAWLATADTVAGEEPGVSGKWDRLTADSFTWRGAWDAGTGYARNDVVAHRASAWLASQATAAGEEPGVSGAWTLLAGGINWRGDWDIATAYRRHDGVHHDGASWLAIQDTEAGEQPSVSAKWDKLAAAGATTTIVDFLAYADRAQLRELTTSHGRLALVQGLELFAFRARSTEPDDDETAFAANDGTGVWLLEAPAWDVAYAYWLGEIDLLWGRILHGTADATISSVASASSASFTGTVVGARPGDRVVATPPGQLGSGRLAHHAYVSAPDEVTITINNPSAASDSLGDAEGTWQIAVIRE